MTTIPALVPSNVRPRSRRRRTVALEQLAMDFGPPRPRWVWSRLVLRSPSHPRILEYVERVRRFFPELDDVSVRVGLAKKRGVLGWGSLDPERPGIWVRPRRLEHFTIAHEMTHLLQARRLVPAGERACDLWALARSPLLVDAAPGYLRVPPGWRGLRPLPAPLGALLCDAARDAIAAREAGDRRYLTRFERRVAGEAAALRLGVGPGGPA